MQSFITHVFPSTANLPKVVQAKLEQRVNADVRASEPTQAPPEPPPAAKIAPKPKRRARKPATASP
jgi:hypothetical protein